MLEAPPGRRGAPGLASTWPATARCPAGSRGCGDAPARERRDGCAAGAQPSAAAKVARLRRGAAGLALWLVLELLGSSSPAAAQCVVRSTDIADPANGARDATCAPCSPAPMPEPTCPDGWEPYQSGLMQRSATAGVLTPPMQVVENHIEVPNGSEADGSASFAWRASTDTTVAFEFDVLAPSDNDDSFFISIDDGSPVTWNIAVSASWQWVSGPATYTVAAGDHTLHIARREDGAKLRTLRVVSGDASFRIDSAENMRTADQPPGWVGCYQDCGSRACPVSPPALCIHHLIASRVQFPPARRWTVSAMMWWRR